MVSGRNCRLCDDALTPANDSKAHIIPSALGGRLKPNGIICRACNTMLDELADDALVKAFGAWPTLLDIPRDRGSNPPKNVKTRGGKTVRIDADGTNTRVDVLYNVTPSSNGEIVHIGAGDMKTFRNLLERAAKQFPQFDPIAAEQHAKKISIDDGDELKLGLTFAHNMIFGAVVAAVWLFLILKTGRAFMDREHLVRVIKSMQSHGGTFRYMVDGLPGLVGPKTSLGHKVIVRSIPRTGKLICYVEILGMLKIGGIFAETPPPGIAVEFIYAYDVASQQDVSNAFSIDSSSFDGVSWESEGLGTSDVEELKRSFTEALDSVFVSYYQNRFGHS